MLFRILLITAIIVIVFKLIRGLTRGGKRSLTVPEISPALPTDRLIKLSELSMLVDALKRTGEDDSFAVLFPAEGDIFNLQFSIIDGTVGLDWVLISEVNIRDRARVKGLAQSYRYSMRRQRQNEVDFLRVTGGNLPALARLILEEIYSLDETDSLHLMVEGFDLPEQEKD